MPKKPPQPRSNTKKMFPVNPDDVKFDKAHNLVNMSSRMGSIIKARAQGGLIGMPINGGGIDYQNGNWVDNKGNVFATSPSEDGKVTPVNTAVHIHLHGGAHAPLDIQKAAKLRNKRRN